MLTYYQWGPVTWSSITKVNLKITYLNYHLSISGAIELMRVSKRGPWLLSYNGHKYFSFPLMATDIFLQIYMTRPRHYISPDSSLKDTYSSILLFWNINLHFNSIKGCVNGKFHSLSWTYGLGSSLNWLVPKISFWSFFLLQQTLLCIDRKFACSNVFKIAIFIWNMSKIFGYICIRKWSSHRL